MAATKRRVLATLAAAAALALAEAAWAGDPAAGERAFGKCKTCHAVVDGGGAVIVKGGRTGPNLWGLPGRTAGTEAGFRRYKTSLVAAGAAGLAWNEADFLAYVKDPRAFLRERLDDPKARSGMTFRLNDAQAAEDIWAFLASVSPEPDG